jgi:hypothetical protein
MARRSSIRASDADRDRVADRLHQAAIEGRLMAHELEERLGHALRARTYGELDAVVADLPREASVAVAPRRPMAVTLLRRYPLPVAVMGCVAGAMFAAMIAAVVVVAASGLWLLPVVAYFVWPRRRDRHFRRRDRHAHTHRMGRSRPGRIF